jgi:hypothetical protein
MGHSIFGKHPLTVYRITKSDQAALPGIDESVDAGLSRMAFRSIADVVDRRSAGFVTLENHRQTEFGPHNVTFGEYHAFGLRIDERKVPPAALKEAIAEACEDELRKRKERDPEAAPFLPKMRKRELRDQVYLRMLAKLPPVPKVVDIVWNHVTGMLFVCEKSENTLKTIETMVLPLAGPGFELHRLQVQDFIPGLDMAAKPGPGCEFLTWLYHRREVDRTYDFGGLAFEAAIEDRIEIGSSGESVKAVTKSDDFPEIDAGLRAGKYVTRAGVRLESGGRVFTLDVSGALFPVGTVEAPKVHKPHDPEELPGAVILAAGDIEQTVKLLCGLLSFWALEAKGRSALGTTGMSAEREVRALQKLLFDYDGTLTIRSGGKSATIGREAA